MDDLDDIAAPRCEACLVLLEEHERGYACPSCGLVRIVRVDT